MLDFDDPQWLEMKGGYRVKYDPRPALQALEKSQFVAGWDELWEQLHHQGDVGEASYAAVPHMVRIGKQLCPGDWNLYALASVVEKCREDGRNPLIPQWLEADYRAAWDELAHMAIARIADAKDESLISSLFATIALFKKQNGLARLALLTESERKTALDELGWA